jgi:hypothetical protein
MDSHQWLVIPNQYRVTLWLFLYFSVLTFTCKTSLHNRLARVSKSRTGGSDSICNSSDKACRNAVKDSIGRDANLRIFVRWLRIHPRMNAAIFYEA